MSCEHKNFQAKVAVNRLQDGEGTPVTAFHADIAIHCADCGLPFRFVGLSAGYHYALPRVSPDGTEMNAPIEPASHAVFASRAEYVLKPKVKQ